MRRFKKVTVHASALLTVMLLSSPLIAHATTKYNGITTNVVTGSALNVTTSTNASITLSSGYLTIDGATAFNFLAPTGKNAQITPNAMTLTTVVAGNNQDKFVTATLGTPGTANDETSANAAYGTMAQANIAAPGSQFAPSVAEDGVQITDVRGTSTGWSLYAYPTDLVSTKDYDLYGATITWTGDLGVENDQLDLNGTPSYYFLPASEPANVTLNVGNGNNNTTTLNNAVQVATSGATAQPAPYLNATGTNQILYNNVALNIPSGSVGMADTYTGTITYDLTVAP
ncbi:MULTISPECIES: WxL domain-containing protein [unclassified Lactococcus]|uniref:WxL domain-containing protein n=1 Tax=unclassified Lactococcus TaxID=2643510 RepID=UPI0016509005|nr:MULTISPECIES: WxL domain-containing protein [unclassified Lactococcus]